VTQIPVPCLFMRGGTSRGPYFRRTDLPRDSDRLAKALIAALGAGHPLNIDGIGGGAAVTTKVAMLSPSRDPLADVDYFFAQVKVEEQAVDFSPSCGNILAGVGPAAIEMGLVSATDSETVVKILATNTGARIEAVVCTPGGRVQYGGQARIDGVPGTAAPVMLKFTQVVGSKTGSLYPTGAAKEMIDGTQVTLIDVAMPMMLLRAADLGITGYETRGELDENRALLERLEALRNEAGRRMGLGDVSASVVPKVGLLAEPRQGGTVTARYFMPWQCHPSMAVTGGTCIASCCLAPGTVAEGIATLTANSPATLVVEHPAGAMEIVMDYRHGAKVMDIRSAGILRTARLLMKGDLMVPAHAWSP